MKSEEVKSKIDKPLSRFVDFGWGIGIRTPTNRVRVCRATVTQFPKICNKNIIPQIYEKSTSILKFLYFF